MSNTQMNPEQAYQTLQDKLYAPVFFTKLAEYGIEPENQAEAAELLKIATHLRAEYAQQAQLAEVQVDPTLTAISAALEKSAAQHPAYAAQRAYTEEAMLKQAATQVAQDPEISAALLTLFSHAAQ